jgi:hypothetical protein
VWFAPPGCTPTMSPLSGRTSEIAQSPEPQGEMAMPIKIPTEVDLEHYRDMLSHWERWGYG